jgi:ribosomal peptide maturation radical SAM protein 1
MGALKSYLQQKFADLHVESHHVYLKIAEAIGYKRYHEISQRTWLAETVYAALLYPDRGKAVEKLFYRKAKGKPLLREVDFQALVKQVEAASNRFIDNTGWDIFDLAGFSICLCQLTAALYFIKRIRQRSSKLIMVAGGSAISGDASTRLLNTFPEIDFLINGEGERPLSNLIGHLIESRHIEAIPAIPGVVSHQSTAKKSPPTINQLDELSSLPVPDYDDFFDLLKTFDTRNHFFPTLPAEISRGCWWAKTAAGDKHSGCAFCNLNLQWRGYRVKDPRQVVSEVDHLTTKHQTVSVAFMDNLVPLKQSAEIFNKLPELNKDFRIFCEIRATTPKRVLTDMKRAGVQEIQIGIEALSTKLLEKLKKGTSAIQNLEIMKHCEELGLVNSSNLIFHFPGSDQDDVSETLHNLEFACYFRPLRFVNFWLGMGSPVWQDPKAHGLQSVHNHPNWKILFPEHVTKSMNFMVQAYRGDLVRQKKLWQPVKQKVRDWKKAYDALQHESRGAPILSFRDGRDFLIIRQRQLGTDPLTHRLVDTARRIYLFCQQRRSLQRILQQFPQVGENKSLPFLKMMVEKKLMFTENDQYLSLAVPVRQSKFL